MGFRLTLDKPGLQNADLAFSFARRLKRTAGYGFTITEATLANELQVPFVSNLPDESAINDFAAEYGEVRVKSVIDQSGSGYNATQATWANMPRIHNGTTLDKVNGQLAVYTDAVAPNNRSCWLRTSGAPSRTVYTVSSVFEFETVADQAQGIWDGETAGAYLAMDNTPDLKWFGTMGSSSVFNPDTDQTLFCSDMNGYRLDSDTADNVIATPTHNMGGVTLMNLRSGYEAANYQFKGYFQEWIRWPDQLDLSAVQADSQEFYFDLLNPKLTSDRMNRALAP